MGARSCIVILQWNANGLKTKMVELEDRAGRLECDVIMIQESKLRSQDTDPKIPGYSTVRKDREVGRGGDLVTFIKEDIPFTVVNSPAINPDSKLELLTVDILAAPTHGMTCTNVYCPPTRGANHVQEFCTSELPFTQNNIIGGDLNVHSCTWDQWQPENVMGGKLEDWLADYNFSIMNDGSATRINAGTGGLSAPDVTMVHNDWLDKVEWSTAECMGSDHLPIVVTVDCPVTTLKSPTSELRWNWSKANFAGFTRDVDASVLAAPPSIALSSLDFRNKFLTDAIMEAAKANIGKVKATKNGKEWMSREIREAIRHRNQLRRDIGSRRRDWVSACREVQHRIQCSKEERWREFISEPDLVSNPNKIWATIKSLSGKNVSSLRNETLIHDGKLYTSSKAKADAFMRRYASISRLDIPKADRHKKATRRLLNAPSAADVSCQDFNLAELVTAIRGMKMKGAPGRDGIAPRFISALGPEAKYFLLKIFNDSWYSGVCPSPWREAIIIPLLKKGETGEQDRLLPSSLAHIMRSKNYGTNGSEPTLEHCGEKRLLVQRSSRFQVEEVVRGPTK